MKNRLLQKFIFLFCLLSFLQTSPLFLSKACAPAPRLGGKVTISDESAIIIWNTATKTEHFIRNAVFNTSEKDFGFLVPTPSVPSLSEMSIPVFVRISQTIQPKTIEKTENKLTFFLLGAFFRSLNYDKASEGKSRPPVRIIDQMQLGSYDTVILEADDADSLATWLQTRGYANSPSLSEWLKPYIEMKWKITAFRIVQPVEDDPIHKNTSPTQFITSPIQMSFSAEKPFFPYREPKEFQETDSSFSRRNLQIFFFSDSKAIGEIKDSAKEWQGKIVWAGKIDDPNSIFGSDINVDQLPKPLYLTVFEDNSSPRPGTNDLFFSQAKDQESISLPPNVLIKTRQLVIPLDLLIPILGVLIFSYFRKRTKLET